MEKKKKDRTHINKEANANLNKSHPLMNLIPQPMLRQVQAV